MSDQPYKIVFIWKKDSAQSGSLQAVQCNDDNLPDEAHWGGSIANAYVQFKTNEQQNACLTVNSSQVVRQTKGRFVYLDVGRWSANIQTFGLIWGNQAVLCSYTASDVAPAPGNGNLLEEFLKLPGVSKTKQLWIDGPNTNDYGMIHVILPDSHVPVSPPLEYPRPKDPPPPNTMWHWSLDQNVYDLWSKRDLFNSRKSVNAAAKFLQMISSVSFASKIQFTQVGDMYELWAGRDCLFKAKSTGPPGVELLGPRNAAEVGGWICDTHEFFPSLFAAYDNCVANCRKCFFIHGNHDSYLSVGDVVAEANRQIAARSSQPQGILFTHPMSKTTVHPRQSSGNIFDRGIFIEHGQRCDGYNNDGNAEGWRKTNQGADIPGGTYFDSTRRTSVVTGAAAIWLARGQDFGCYVMGHTHSADLSYVEVTHRVEETHIAPTGPVWVIEPKI